MLFQMYEVIVSRMVRWEVNYGVPGLRVTGKVFEGTLLSSKYKI